MDSSALLARMKAKWHCKDCNQGHLEIVLYTKMGDPWYFRQCSECPNRTKAQPHHPNVEGIRKEIPSEAPVKLGKQSKSYKDR